LSLPVDAVGAGAATGGAAATGAGELTTLEDAEMRFGSFGRAGGFFFDARRSEASARSSLAARAASSVLEGRLTDACAPKDVVSSAAKVAATIARPKSEARRAAWRRFMRGLLCECDTRKVGPGFFGAG
jgi:hypothetical protein